MPDDTTVNMARCIAVPTSHAEFMALYGHKRGFWEGWQDALAKMGFRAEYERSDASWQHSYENGREFVIRLRSEGYKPHPWPNRHKPGPHVFRSIKPLLDGRA